MRTPLLSGRRPERRDRKSTRLNSSHTVIYTLSLHDALPIWFGSERITRSSTSSSTTTMTRCDANAASFWTPTRKKRSEEHTSELQSHRDLHSFPTRRSSDLVRIRADHPLLDQLLDDDDDAL